MKKLLIVAMLLVISSGFKTKELRPYVLFSNQRQEAVRLEIYYDFQDGEGWSYWGSLNIPGAYTRSITFDDQIWRYRYCTNRDGTLRQIIGEIIYLY